MAQSPNSRLKRVAVAGLTVAGASVMSLATVIPAGAVNTPPTNVSANNLIIGSGSSTTYSVMVQIGDLFNAALTCPMTTANKTVVAAPLDFGCIKGGGGDPVALDASPTNTPENPWADVAVQEPAIGSSSGINQLTKASGIHGTSVNVWTGVNFARSSRQARTDSGGDYTGLNFVAYAEDAISWFHFLSVPGNDTTTTETNGASPHPTSTPNGINVPTPSANLQDLTQAQLKGIYSGAYTNWDQITDAEGHTGANAPIVVFAPQEGSGTQATASYYLGGSVATPYDETSASNKVNCTTYFDSTAYKAESTPAVSGCQGPIVTPENVLYSLNKNSVLPAQSSLITGSTAIPSLSGTEHDTLIDNRSTTTAIKLQKGKNSASLTDATAVAPGAVLTFAGEAGTYTVASVTPAVTKKGVTTPAKVTFNVGQNLTFSQQAGSSVTWTNTSKSTKAWTNADINAAVRGDAVFLYSFGKWESQTNAGESGTGASATLNAANCGTENCGSMGVSPGYTATLGNLDSTPLNKYTDITQSFPMTRYLYNVYSNGSNSKIPAATAPTLNLVSESGFICKPQNASIVDPSSTTGATYLNELQGIIEAQGFYPITNGDANGMINQTPTDIGNVGHPASGMTLTATGSQQTGTTTATLTIDDYSQYMNVPGTGLAGGYQQDSTNSQALGFCLVSTTDSSAAGS